MEPKEINYAGSQKIFNKELTEQKISEAVSAEESRAINEESRIENKIDSEITRATEAETDLNDKLEAEITARENGDIALDNKIGDIGTLETETKDNTVAAINELVNKQTELTEKFDSVLPYDKEPTEGSEKGAESGGIFNAIRFASVEVGETMFWPECEIETREVVSDKPFTFKFKDHDITVEPETPATIELKISKNEPDGWWPLNGKAELYCNFCPELAKFFGGTQNPDGSWNNDGNNVADDWIDDGDGKAHSFNAKIWLPYVQQKIIKAKY